MAHVRRLEQLLRYWEDRCFILKQILIQYAGTQNQQQLPELGPLDHAPTFRRHLLESLDVPFDADRFRGSTAIYRALLDYAGSTVANAPGALFAWTKHSRRVYQMSAELEQLLLVTSLKEITWADVPWPFPSFAVSLNTAIYSASGAPYDFLLISRETLPTVGEFVSIRLISSEFEKYEPLGQADYRTVDEYVRRCRWKLLERWIARRGRSEPRMSTGVVHVVAQMKNTHVTDSLIESARTFGLTVDDIRLEIKDAKHAEWDVAARLIVGLCLYLQTLPGKRHTSQWRPIPRSAGFDPTALTKTSEVCYVTSSHRLAPELKDVA